jgi:DNA-binding LacI/PurR family transcriptional regulator
LTHDARRTLKLNFGGETAYHAVLSFVDAGYGFDSIFAASDVLAMAAIHALQARDLNVPKKVSVVGYDNIAAAATSTPSLTTIDQNIKLGGEMMVDLLMRKMAGEHVASTLTPTRLVIRQSCGAPSA